MDFRKFKILQVLSHNALLCIEDISLDTQEMYIFFGKGIGFKKKADDLFIYDEKIANGLLVLKPNEAKKYKQLLKTITNEKLINAVYEITQEAHKFFNGQISAKLNLSLLDHLNFAITRHQNNIVFNYPFLDELRFIYPKEFIFAKHALNYLNTELNLNLDQSEIGFLILHLHASIKNTKVSTVLINNEISYLCTNLIEAVIKEKIDKESIYYARFLKHLEFAIKRAKENIHIQNVMLKDIISKCQLEYQIASKMAKLLKTKYKINLDENEIGYLALHIYNLKNKEVK